LLPIPHSNETLIPKVNTENEAKNLYSKFFTREHIRKNGTVAVGVESIYEDVGEVYMFYMLYICLICVLYICFIYVLYMFYMFYICRGIHMLYICFIYVEVYICYIYVLYVFYI